MIAQIMAFAAVTLAVVSLTVCPAQADEADLAALLDGVAEIAAPGMPGPICVYGDRAFPVVVGSAGKSLSIPVAAAGRLGEGRTVALGHDGYFGAEALGFADTGRFIANAVRWCGAKSDPRVAVRNLPDLLSFFKAQGIGAEALDDAAWVKRLKEFNVLCCPAGELSDREVAAVMRFVERGGGFITGIPGWGWLELNPGKDIADLPANQILAPAGIQLADGWVRHTTDNGYSTKDNPSTLCHGAEAINAIIAHSEGKIRLTADQLAEAASTAGFAARSLPARDKLLRPRLEDLRKKRRASVVPTDKKPIATNDPIARLALTLDIEETRSAPVGKVKAHPAASDFPGSVPPDARRVTRSVEVDTSVPDWHGTGLYAPPGGIIRVEAPESALTAGLRVRIGAHGDRLWHLDSWPRVPEICREFAISRRVTRAANAFGGLVYIVVPERCKLGTIKVKISGAVEAPRYVLGQTSAAEWRERIRNKPAPWAELETSKIILTVPSTAIRTLDDPEDTMKFWDRVSDATADLAHWPRERARPERYLTDRQISAGYMHSGYPIMTLLDVADVIVRKDRILENEHRGVWGLFHELGHNHQSGDYTPSGMGEVTVNLFTLYVMDTVCGIPVEKSRKDFTPEGRMSRMKPYFDQGANYEKLVSDPFLALILYIQIQESFGWDAYKKVVAEYHSLPDSERPKTDDERRDQWLVRLSRTVGRNMGPFLAAWGIPTSEKARASVADLPVWMPEGFPPK